MLEPRPMLMISSRSAHCSLAVRWFRPTQQSKEWTQNHKITIRASLSTAWMRREKLSRTLTAGQVVVELHGLTSGLTPTCKSLAYVLCIKTTRLPKRLNSSWTPGAGSESTRPMGSIAQVGRAEKKHLSSDELIVYCPHMI